ncbi:MAG: hypothetical protein R2710_12735 [Acidimicrobiales bacterium]
MAAALAGEFGIGRRRPDGVLANNNTNTFEVQSTPAGSSGHLRPLNWRLTIPELEFIVGDSHRRS